MPGIFFKKNIALNPANKLRDKCDKAYKTLLHEQRQLILLLVKQIKSHPEMNKGINAISLKLSDKLKHLASIAKNEDVHRTELTRQVNVVAKSINDLKENCSFESAETTIKKYQHFEKITIYINKLREELNKRQPMLRIPLGLDEFWANVKILPSTTFLSRLLLGVGLIAGALALVIVTNGGALPLLSSLCLEPFNAAFILGGTSLVALTGGMYCQFFSSTLKNQMASIYNLLKEMSVFQESEHRSEINVSNEIKEPNHALLAIENKPANEEKSFAGVEKVESVICKIHDNSL